MLETIISVNSDKVMMDITEDDAKEFVASWRDAYARKSASFFQDILPDDNSILGIGTNEDELLRNNQEILDQIERDLSEVDVVNLDLEIIHFDSANDLCWFACLGKLVVTIGSNLIKFDTRTTMVLQRVEGDLKLRQSHWSMPHPGGEEGKSYPTKDGMYNQLNEWISNFDLNSNFSEEFHRSKVKSYLIKALKAIETQET